MIKRSLKKSKVNKRDNFLNPSQRRELKKILLDKFVKLYGLSNPEAVKKQVDSFFKNNPKINSKTLEKLENQVKREALKYKSITTKNPS